MASGTGPSERPPRSPLSYVGLGFEIVVPLVLFMWVGHELDDWRGHEQPWFMLGGAIVGIAVGFYSFLRGFLPRGGTGGSSS
jgi:hypothetical protein